MLMLALGQGYILPLSSEMKTAESVRRGFPKGGKRKLAWQVKRLQQMFSTKDIQ
jgi:hypothetical protein